MDKIYSRRRIHLPKCLTIPKKIYSNVPNNYFALRSKNNKVKKVTKVSIIIIIAILTAKLIIASISPILDKQCMNMAKVIATKISNEQTSYAISKYRYNDICSVTKDANR